jgi:hypothetical protein
MTFDESGLRGPIKSARNATDSRQKSPNLRLDSNPRNWSVERPEPDNSGNRRQHAQTGSISWGQFQKPLLESPTIMGSPQDPRTSRRKRERRAKKNAEWELKRARENAEAAMPKTPAKTAT